MDFKNELSDFINEKNIVGVCAGVIIAFVTKDVVLSLVADIVIPLCILLIIRTRIPLPSMLTPDKSKHLLSVTKFIASLVTWFVSIIITYFFIKFAFVHVLGVSDKKNKPEERDKDKDKEMTTSTANTSNVDVDAFTMMFG